MAQMTEQPTAEELLRNEMFQMAISARAMNEALLEQMKSTEDLVALRDYFAALAMQPLIAKEGGTYASDAEQAYKAADAMLAARTATQEKGK
jgi:hypothetical protein